MNNRRVYQELTFRKEFNQRCGYERREHSGVFQRIMHMPLWRIGEKFMKWYGAQ